MSFEEYAVSGGKRLRRGYTTGACAAAAARAAAVMLASGAAVPEVTIVTPGGVRLSLAVEDARGGEGWASCAVRKDAGADADATDGILVYARVCRAPDGEIAVDGGGGVGRVTRPGLEQPVGAAAINRVPREMIARAVRETLGAGAGAFVTISVPAGAEIAKKTYNARLGIEGGISILGTTGIVEPMSEAALIDTIRAELDVLRAEGARPILLTPGNYGETFAREAMGLSLTRSVLCSNFAGDALDYAALLGFEGVLLVGHIGKLVKLAGGIFQTHSRTADARMEILTAHAALAGADRSLARGLMDCVTTDAALDLLDAAGLLEQTMGSILRKIDFHIGNRLGGVPSGAVMFSNARGILGKTDGANELILQFRHREDPE